MSKPKVIELEITKKITTRSVLGYALLPRIWPRVKELFRSGFAQVAFFMAHVYAMVKLLPANHPYLQAKNIGAFGVRHVIAQAANHLVIRKENIDQIIVFFLLVVGFILLILQFAAIIYTFLLHPTVAHAGPGDNFTSVFATMEPKDDIALNMLDRVFGVPEVACTGTKCTQYHIDSLAGGPTPFHIGLHNMYQFYSLGILVIGVIVFLYYLMIIVGETATTGSPFGQRFQNIWVPIRLVVAIGLLLPMNYGLNGAQYITLYAAKWGSGLATNAWTQFNRVIADKVTQNPNPTGEHDTLLAKPIAPSIVPIAHFMSLAHACAYADWQFHHDDMKGNPPSSVNAYAVKAYMVKASTSGSGEKLFTAGTSYKDALDFFENGDIFIRFGEKNPGHTTEKGNVKPICGEIRISTSSVEEKGNNKGPDAIQNAYFKIVQQMWFSNEKTRWLGQRHIAVQTNNPFIDPCTIGSGAGFPTTDCKTKIPTSEVGENIVKEFKVEIESAVKTTWDNYRTYISKYAYDDDFGKRGWGGAGMWYNQIARINGGFIGATVSIPSVAPTGLPLIMREVLDESSAQNNALSNKDMYCPNYENEKPGSTFVNKDDTIARMLCNFHQYWVEDPSNFAEENSDLTGNSFVDAVHLIFGTRGLFDMRGENINIHPMAQLSALGKGLVDSAVANIGASTVFGFGGSMIGALGYHRTGVAIGVASKMISAVAFFGLLAGVLLFYLLPFMPFIYFFFAVGTWIKTIFEAMVGVPLWALAHLRMDGEGLPGESAINGYFLIFEIFVRPVLIVFGLIGAMIIFTMQVRALNFIWDVALNNLTGFKGEQSLELVGQQINMGPVDNFFFTIIYAIIVYMLATASFKMIDRVPSQIMRWMGSGATAYGDIAQENIDQIRQYVAVSGLATGQQAIGAFSQAGEGLGGVVGGFGRSIGAGAIKSGP